MAECITPLIVKIKLTNMNQEVRCGRCPNCYAYRASGWSARLMQEEKRAYNPLFITLTYDTSKVPLTKAGFMDLRKRDLQLFFKRLRKKQDVRNLELNWPSIKYYAVGEYGGKSKRPHYHVILFNASTELIQPAWDLGNIHYGQVTGASIGYTLKYMYKGPWKPMHRNDDRNPQFSLMSKGLGENYINEKTIKWHHADLENRMYLPLLDGKKASMPRYYKQKIYTEIQRKKIAAHQKIENEKRKAEAELKGGDTYYRDKAENDAAAFRKMYKDAERGRDKV